MGGLGPTRTLPGAWHRPPRADGISRLRPRGPSLARTASGAPCASAPAREYDPRRLQRPRRCPPVRQACRERPIPWSYGSRSSRSRSWSYKALPPCSGIVTTSSTWTRTRRPASTSRLVDTFAVAGEHDRTLARLVANPGVGKVVIYTVELPALVSGTVDPPRGIRLPVQEPALDDVGRGLEGCPPRAHHRGTRAGAATRARTDRSRGGGSLAHRGRTDQRAGGRAHPTLHQLHQVLHPFLLPQDRRRQSIPSDPVGSHTTGSAAVTSRSTR